MALIMLPVYLYLQETKGVLDAVENLNLPVILINLIQQCFFTSASTFLIPNEIGNDDIKSECG